MTNYPESGIIIIEKGWRYKRMKEYKIYAVNNVKVVKGLERAMEYAERESRVGYRVSVFDGNTKIATYQGGEKIF